MGENWGSLFPQQQFNWQSPNSNYLGASLSFGQQNTHPLFMDSNINMVSPNGILPGCPFAKLLCSQDSQENEPHGWFYGLPRFRQAFMPPLNSVLKEKRPLLDTLLKEKLLTASRDNKEDIMPKSDSGGAQKRFLVFDQSGNQTTLIFSSGIGTPVQSFKSWVPKPTVAFDLIRDGPMAKENKDFHLWPIATDEFVEGDGIDMQTDMHEDSEELNALLYSDDDSDYAEDEEVTSTGHSPSTMTTHDKLYGSDGSAEEVASSDGSSRKRKLFDGGSDVPSLLDTASSVKATGGFECEDDAESRCGNDTNLVSDEMGAESGIKRMRKERIRETVSVLQNLIPGGKGKEAIVVLEEAIEYLKSLKFKAKALGLNAP